MPVDEQENFAVAYKTNSYADKSKLHLQDEFQPYTVDSEGKCLCFYGIAHLVFKTGTVLLQCFLYLLQSYGSSQDTGSKPNESLLVNMNKSF